MVYLLKYEENKLKRKEAMNEIWKLDPDATIVFQKKDFDKALKLRSIEKHPRYWKDMEPEFVYNPDPTRSYHKNK